MKNLFCLFNYKTHIGRIILMEIFILLVTIISLFLPAWKMSLDTGGDRKEYNFTLNPGRYLVTIEYVAPSTDTSSMIFTRCHDTGIVGHGSPLKTNVEFLSPYTDSYTFEMWVGAFNTNMDMSFIPMSDAPMEDMSSITIVRTRFFKFCVLIVILAVIAATFFVYAVMTKRLTLNGENILVIVSLIAITLISAFPLFTKYIHLGADALFHITRIDGIKDGLYAGQFPVRVEPVYLYGAGYAISLFYGGIFFYIPAFFRIIGFDLQFSYKFMILFIDAMTAITSYSFFREISKSKKAGILGSAIYTLSYYRFYDIFFRGAVGETIALAILPLLALGLYRIFTRPFNDRYSRLWIMPAMAFTLLIESHLISTLIFGAFTVFVCLILAKRTFRKQTFIVLLKTIIFSVLLNLFFLVPMFDCLTNLSLQVNYDKTIDLDIQAQTITYRDMFKLEIPRFDYEAWYQQYYPRGYGPATGIGIAFSLICICILLFNGIIKKKKISGSNNPPAHVFPKEPVFWGVLAVITVFTSTEGFPWTKILVKLWNGWGGIFRPVSRMFAMVQFSYRYAGIALLFVTASIIIALTSLYAAYNNAVCRRICFCVGGLITLISIAHVILIGISIICTQNNEKKELFYIQPRNSLYCTQIGNGEYVPLIDGIWMNLPALEDGYCYADGVIITDLRKDHTNVTLTATNVSDKTQDIEVQLVYYPGYSAKNTVTGKKIPVYQGAAGRAAVSVGAGETMSVKIWYSGKALWHVCEIISAVTLIFTIFSYKFRRKTTY